MKRRRRRVEDAAGINVRDRMTAGHAVEVDFESEEIAVVEPVVSELAAAHEPVDVIAHCRGDHAERECRSQTSVTRVRAGVLDIAVSCLRKPKVEAEIPPAH